MVVVPPPAGSGLPGNRISGAPPALWEHAAPSGALILVASPDVRTLQLMGKKLESAGYRVLLENMASSALREATPTGAELAVVDQLFPGANGLDLVRRIRGSSSVPLLLLTRTACPSDVVEGLQAGADACMAKPFPMEELLARVRVMLWRARSPGGETWQGDAVVCGDLSIDMARRRVARRRREIVLTRTEYKLLSILAANPGRLMLCEELVSQVWGPGCQDNRDCLRAYIGRLRHKIEPDPVNPRYVLTRPGFGYLLDNPPPEKIRDSSRERGMASSML